MGAGPGRSKLPPEYKVVQGHHPQRKPKLRLRSRGGKKSLDRNQRAASSCESAPSVHPPANNIEPLLHQVDSDRRSRLPSPASRLPKPLEWASLTMCTWSTRYTRIRFDIRFGSNCAKPSSTHKILWP